MASQHPITFYRREHGLTLQEFAAKLDVHYTTVLRIEAGAREPSAKLMRKIAEVTGGAVTAGDLVEFHAQGPAESAREPEAGSPSA